ncbi:MAG: hypothetical protein AB1817_10980 [Chloroflexota bacterium]
MKSMRLLLIVALVAIVLVATVLPMLAVYTHAPSLDAPGIPKVKPTPPTYIVPLCDPPPCDCSSDC